MNLAMENNVLEMSTIPLNNMADKLGQKLFNMSTPLVMGFTPFTNE